jgi:NADH dehydrogenase FAD-containing subunit
VRASRAAEWLNAPADRAYRLQVEPDLTVPGHPDIFAVGDTVTIAARRQSGAGHRAGGEAAGALRRRADQGAADAARCRRSATSMPAASRRSARRRR